MLSIYNPNGLGGTSTSAPVDGIVRYDMLGLIYPTEMHEKSYPGMGQLIQFLPKLKIRPVMSYSY